jgi:hypothetical protein
MRKLLLTAVTAVLSLIAFSSGAQCIPDTSITHNVNGIYPDSATGLPHANVGVPYSTVIQLKVLRDTTYNGAPAQVNTFTITGVTGLPTGWTYSCTPSSCAFPGGSDACLLLQGPAPSVGQVGVYPLTVNLSVAGVLYPNTFPIPLTIPSSITQYTIYIDNTTGINTAVLPGRFTVSDFAPNPFSSSSKLMIGVTESGTVRMEILDVLGNKVRETNYPVQRGWNSIQVDADNLRSGIYLSKIYNGKDVTVRRMIVNGH